MIFNLIEEACHQLIGIKDISDRIYRIYLDIICTNLIYLVCGQFNNMWDSFSRMIYHIDYGRAFKFYCDGSSMHKLENKSMVGDRSKKITMIFIHFKNVWEDSNMSCYGRCDLCYDCIRLL
jgi:hypothetical protein